MEQIYIQRKGDRKELFKYRDMFMVYSNKQLIESYNNSVDTGIVGAHQQALYLIALKKVFNIRFGKSPIKIEDNIIISLSGKIVQEGESYVELLNVKLHLIDDYIQYQYIDSIVDLNSDFVDVKSYLKGNKKALLLRLSHSKINTQLILTDVTPYVLLYFDEFLAFKGASYSIKNGENSFVIQTQYKTILLVQNPLNFELNTVIKLSYVD